MVKKLLLVLFVLFGCTPKVEKVDLDQKVKIEYFYLTTCSECKAFKENAIPYLEEKFQDSIEIQQYDLDDQATEEPYDQVIDSLKDFDHEYYGFGPFIVVGNYFAILGYTAGDEEYIADDIINATKNKPYSDELEGLRFLFQ